MRGASSCVLLFGPALLGAVEEGEVGLSLRERGTCAASFAGVGVGVVEFELNAHERGVRGSPSLVVGISFSVLLERSELDEAHALCASTSFASTQPEGGVDVVQEERGGRGVRGDPAL